MKSPQQIAMDMVNAIPGCDAQRFALEGNTVITGRVMGWGPSLHRTGMAWAAHPTDMSVEAITKALQPYINIQQSRVAVAKQIGLATDKQPEGIDHIVIDRELLDIRPDAPSHVEGAIARLDQLSISGKRTHLTSFAVTVSDDPGYDRAPRCTFAKDLDDFIYNGVMLFFKHSAPETITTALQGRKVEDVVSITDKSTDAAKLIEKIAKRKITSADNEFGKLAIHFDGDWVSLRS